LAKFITNLQSVNPRYMSEDDDFDDEFDDEEDDDEFDDEGSE
jgi:hypothetical protein